MEHGELITEIERQRSLMIAVATGGPRINHVNDQYRERRQLIRAGLRERGLEDPNPYRDLWEWYGKWSSDLAGYQSRREYVTELYAPLLNRLESGEFAARDAELTGWARVDREVSQIREQLARADSEEEYQTVGLLSRETLISLAQEVFDPETHETVDDVEPSKTDAKRMLQAVIAAELAGGSNEAARRHVRASLSLANDLQHRRTATFREAALCTEATISVVHCIGIITGRFGENRRPTDTDFG